MIRKLIHDIEGKWWLLIFVVILYSGLAICDGKLFTEAIEFFWQTFVQIIPVVLVVFGLMFLFNLLISTKTLVKHLGSSKKLRGWVIAIATGIISSGPIYMWLPLLADLRERGVRDSFVTAFLYSRSIKLPLLPMMIYYFGTAFTVVLSIYIIIFSFINGMIMRYVMKNKIEKGVKQV